MGNFETMIGKTAAEARSLAAISKLTQSSLADDGVIESYVSAGAQGASAGLTAGIRGAVRDAVVGAFEKVLEEAKAKQQSMVKPYLTADESVVETAEIKQKLPFLFRIIPFVPDVLTAPKRFLLAITDDRVIILLIAARWNRLRGDYVKKVVLNVSLGEIEEVAVLTGWSTRLSIRLRGGRRYRFHTHAAESVAESIRSATAACGSR